VYARVTVQHEDFDIAALQADLLRQPGAAGATAIFVGHVRSSPEEPVLEMELEHYPGMTERSIEAILDEAASRWSLLATRVVHRVGTLAPGDQIVCVGVSSAHRGDAFQACEFIMDYLKTRAPFWKKEITGSGSRWVEARSSDELAAGRWRVTGTDSPE
jgi:molybdopterin synthase catalytic subunit